MWFQKAGLNPHRLSSYEILQHLFKGDVMTAAKLLNGQVLQRLCLCALNCVWLCCVVLCWFQVIWWSACSCRSKLHTATRTSHQQATWANFWCERCGSGVFFVCPQHSGITLVARVGQYVCGHPVSGPIFCLLSEIMPQVLKEQNISNFLWQKFKMADFWMWVSVLCCTLKESSTYLGMSMSW